MALEIFWGWSDNSVVVQIYLYDCTEVSPYCLLFFGGDISIQKDKEQDTIAVDEWIVFQSPARIAHLVKNLRQELDDLLQEKIENPHPVDWNDIKSRDTAVLTAIIDLITTQENEGVRNFAPRFQGERYSWHASPEPHCQPSHLLFYSISLARGTTFVGKAGHFLILRSSYLELVGSMCTCMCSVLS